MAQDDLSGLKIDRSAKAFRPGRRRRIVIATLAVLLLAGLGYLYGSGVLRPAVTVETTSVSQVYPTQTFLALSASGYVVAQRKAAVASKMTGRLASLHVEEGSRVRQGQVIAELEHADLLAQVAQAQANLEMARFQLAQVQAEHDEAQRHYERSRELLARQVLSRSAFDAAEGRYRRAQAAVASGEAAVQVARAALAAAEVSVGYTRIVAPFDGVVLTKNADIGDIVTPIGAAANAKAAVVTMADMGSLQVEADVSEANLGLVRQGQPCEIQLDAIPGKRFAGAVHAVVPTADRTKASVLVKVRFGEKDPRILPEMSAKVAFLSRPARPEDRQPRPAVNRAALVQRQGKTRAFVLAGDRVREASVQTGKDLGDLVEVVAGLAVGDRVVLRPPPSLREGSRIKVNEP